MKNTAIKLYFFYKNVKTIIGDIMNFKSDFADEILDVNKKDYKKKIKEFNGIKMTSIEILKDKNSFNKEKGKYISIDFKNMYDEKTRVNVSEFLVKSLHELYKIHKDDKILIVGLGNEKIIADSLGPVVANKIVVTNHLFHILPENDKKNMNKVCVFTPKVMGQTGLESADLIKAVKDIYNPSLIIIVDALATSSISRINKVIQLSDTGIAPGSGVGNYRKEINEKNMKCKVIAIGVATVVKASNIIEELNLDIKMKDESDYDLILTPKEIDEEIEHLSTIIASSINNYSHSNFKSM